VLRNPSIGPYPETDESSPNKKPTKLTPFLLFNIKELIFGKGSPRIFPTAAMTEVFSLANILL
jgi:hypothetical protein